MRNIRFILIVPFLLLALGCSISQEQEIAIGRQVHPQFEQEFGGLYPDERVQQYVDRVGQSLVNFAGRRDLPWQFRVVNSDQINAFALPGGYVYISKGMLDQLENESQLAAILGHEIGHVVERHSVRQMQRAQGAQFVPLLAGIFGGGQVADVAGAVTGLSLMKYGRDQEREADYQGLKYIVRAGYDPRGIVNAMQIIQRSGGRSGPEFLSTHPNPGNRVKYLDDRIRKRYPDSGGIVGTEDFRRVVHPRNL